jgi:hypothetical protein
VSPGDATLVHDCPAACPSGTHPPPACLSEADGLVGHAVVLLGDAASFCGVDVPIADGDFVS